ncbi:transporter substrate-binding domain-containing protein [Brachyspira alvinipulli]|uniref:transporter substrate-binding domain-containing protein n=1 Tax=Brachyspira alvinipulli TaxID=84379 RepID=UPI000481F289|nr:transporter substrate-binding domain-containing protein [Brachyspira alvinipulli]
MKKKIFIILIAMLYLIACKNNNNQNNNKEYIVPKDTVTNEVVKVGIYVYDSPFVYLDNDNISGFDYDLINEIAKVFDLKLEFVQMKFDKLIPSLQIGEVDCIVAGLSVTEERKKLVSFSTKYYQSAKSVLINKKDDGNIKTTNDLIGKTIGVIRGTVGDITASKMNGVNVKRYNSSASTLLSLKIGVIDAIMFDKVTCEYYTQYDQDVKIVEGIEFSEDDYAIAVRKDDDELLQKINVGLYTIMNNGVYDELVEKYLK